METHPYVEWRLQQAHEQELQGVSAAGTTAKVPNTRPTGKRVGTKHGGRMSTDDEDGAGCCDSSSTGAFPYNP